jgi:EAL domain-containing protein (putative c-di-GMP-specific phosphodiesterase class I)
MRDGLNPGVVAVNVSVLQLKNINFLSDLKTLIKEYDFDVKHLEIELTESQLMSKTDETIEILKKISELGIKIAIDDFGTGYSSLSYLKRLPIDVLKIDRSFIKDIPFENNDVEVTKAIIAIAKSLKFSTVAEGVETIEQLEFLKANGCDVIQGYYYYKPMNADDLEELLHKKRSTK